VSPLSINPNNINNNAGDINKVGYYRQIRQQPRPVPYEITQLVWNSSQCYKEKD
jgi:hypothetical protein